MKRKEIQLDLDLVFSCPITNPTTPVKMSDDDIIAEAKKILNRRTRKGTTFTSAQSVKDYLQVTFAEEDREHFMVIYLNTQHQIISKEVLFTGTIDSAAVYPREVVKRSLELGSAAIILAHNHPSGTMETSMADTTITDRIKTACDTVNIRLLDHFIATGQGTLS